MPTETCVTLGMTQLARAWLRRLQAAPGPGQRDALVVLEGPAQVVGCRMELDQAARSILITRGPAAARAPGEEIALPSAFVSEPHAELCCSAGRWTIHDRQSNNHLYVGTVRVEQQRLVYGDEIRVGDVTLVFVSGDREALPAHTLDQPSGLLGGRIFIAEGTRLLQGSEARGLLLLRARGLREQLLQQAEAAALLPRRVGQLLLELDPAALAGRLEAELFAVLCSERQGPELERLAQAVLGRLEPAASAARVALRVALLEPGEALAGQPAVTLPQAVACCTVALERGGADGCLVRADPAAGRLLLARDALLRELCRRPERPLLLLSLQDEDRLRHLLGHDQLAACRWQLRQALGQLPRLPRGDGGAVVGALGEGLFVLAPASQPAGRELADALEQALASHPVDWPVPWGPRLRRVWLLQRAVEPAALEQEIVVAQRVAEPLGPRLEVDGLPTPLALPYALVWAAASPAGQLKAMLDCAEAAARFVGCALLARLAQQGQPLAQEKPALPAQEKPALLARPRLPLGQWVVLLRQAARSQLASGQPLDQLLQQAAGRRGQRVRAAHLLERGLLPERNRFAHRQRGASEEQLRQQVPQLLTQLNELLRQLQPLCGLQLLTVLTSQPRRSGGLRARVRVHQGPRESFEVHEVDLQQAQPLFVGGTYLCTPDYRQLVELSPLVRLELCPHCDRLELFVAEGLGLSRGELRLGAVSTGHQLTRQLGPDDVPPELAQLLGWPAPA